MIRITTTTTTTTTITITITAAAVTTGATKIRQQQKNNDKRINYVYMQNKYIWKYMLMIVSLYSHNYVTFFQ